MKMKQRKAQSKILNFSLRFFLFAFFLFIFLSPVSASAAEWIGLVPTCGATPARVVGTGGETTRTYTPCSTCDLAKLVKNTLDFVVKNVALAGVALMLMVGGFQMVAGGLGGSASPYQKGKDTIKNAFIGLAIVLFAWLAVDTIIKFIAQQSLTSGSPAKLFENEPGAGEIVDPEFSISSREIGYGVWNKIKCTKSEPVKVVTKPPPPPSKIPPPSTTPPPPGPPSGVTQEVIPSEYKTAAEEARSAATFQSSGSCQQISPQKNISEAAAGKQITFCSRGCTATEGCGGIGGGGFVTPNLAMLQGFKSIYNICGDYTVISIAGGAEHVSNSKHYQGRAIDIKPKKPKGFAWTDCLNNIRATLGGVDSSPTSGTFCDTGGTAVDCANASHIHVSFTP